MDYQKLVEALQMIWEDKPRLDILACRDEAFGLLDPVLQDFTDYAWNKTTEQQNEIIDNLDEDSVDLVIDAIVDAIAFGVDLYLACNLAEHGRLTATGRKTADTGEVFSTLENKDLAVEILNRFPLIPLVLLDYSQDGIESIMEDVEELAGYPWGEVEALRRNLLSCATTSFVFTALHLEAMYPVAENKPEKQE